MKRQAKTLILMSLAAGLIISACGKKEEPAAPPAAEAQVAPDAVVARVSGTVITGQMYNQRLNAMVQQYSMQFPPEQINQLKPMLRQQAVAALINENLLFQEATRQGITPTEEDIDKQIEEIIGQFPSRAAFESQLGMSGMTLETLRENIKPGLSIQKLVDAQLPEDSKATDEEIAKFYAENPAQFERPEQVEASHILIQVSPGESEEVKAAKRLEIEALREKIAGGEEFAEWARQSSQDQGSRERGGSLGFFGRGQMIPAFEEVAFSLESGALSEVVETQFGYHLIQVTGKREAGTVPLEEVSEQIGMFLTNQKNQAVVGEFLRNLREKAEIEYGPGFQPVPPPPAGPAQFPPARPPQ